eukprot:scaffold518823_cov29-Prasinocladus_malaysianus.AAC.1
MRALVLAAIGFRMDSTPVARLSLCGRQRKHEEPCVCPVRWWLTGRLPTGRTLRATGRTWQALRQATPPRAAWRASST